MKREMKFRHWLEKEGNWRLIEFLIGAGTLILMIIGINTVNQINVELKEIKIEKLTVEKEGHGVTITPGATTTFESF